MFALPLLGGGYGWIQLAIDGKLAIWVMLALAFGKILALSLTVSSGGSGGVFAPSLYVGAMLGGALAAIIDALTHAGPNPAAFTVVGMAALFAGAARVPVATLIMVAEMTGGYKLILPTMIAVAVSYVVQVALTRHATYPSLYEAQVPQPVDSPAHHKIYYEAVANMLRQRKVRLDDDIVGQELMDRLSRGQGVPLMGGDEFLYSVEILDDTAFAGHRLDSIAFPEGTLVVSILRDQGVVVPKDDTALQVGDRLTVAATPQAMEALRRILKPDTV
jgi:CIC family chloride channel protein